MPRLYRRPRRARPSRKDGGIGAWTGTVQRTRAQPHRERVRRRHRGPYRPTREARRASGEAKPSRGGIDPGFAGVEGGDRVPSFEPSRVTGLNLRPASRTQCSTSLSYTPDQTGLDARAATGRADLPRRIRDATDRPDFRQHASSGRHDEGRRRSSPRSSISRIASRRSGSRHSAVAASGSLRSSMRPGRRGRSASRRSSHDAPRARGIASPRSRRAPRGGSTVIASSSRRYRPRRRRGRRSAPASRTVRPDPRA